MKKTQTKTQDLKDMSAKVGDKLTMEEFKAMQKQYEELTTANDIKLSAKVKAKKLIPGKEIIDKQTGIPVVDDAGQVRTYADTFIVTLNFEGGSLEYKCDEQVYKELELNSRYLFKGYLGHIKEFGKEVLSPIFTAYELV